MAPASQPDRASAFHRRAMDRVSQVRGDADRRADAGRRDAPSMHDSGTAAAAEGAELTLPGAGVLGIALVGLALGLSGTALVLARGWDPGAVAVGPWVARPRVGTVAIDPYARAELARSGAVPMAASEGLSFAAATDDTGYRLLRTCSYRLSGAVPAARFWTLTATGQDGRTMDDPAHRSAFTSTTVIRDLAGRFTIEASPAARPGNWLPLAGAGPLTLTLRLYDTPLTGNPAEAASATLPSITRQSCEAPGGRGAP